MTAQFNRDPRALAQKTFFALMAAFNDPGQVQRLPSPITTTCEAFVALAPLLLDPETTYFTADEDLKAALGRTGARPSRPPRAAYHFYLRLDLDVVRTASAGTLLLPDQNATLLLAAQLDHGLTLNLSGPGIPSDRRVQVGGIPAAFWQLREDKARYPLGWDIYLIDANRVLGLPRTTRIEIAGAGV